MKVNGYCDFLKVAVGHSRLRLSVLIESFCTIGAFCPYIVVPEWASKSVYALMMDAWNFLKNEIGLEWWCPKNTLT